MNDMTEVKDTAPENARVATRAEPALLPPVDVVEDAQGITLWADLAGVQKEKLSLRVGGDQLSLEGEITLPLPTGMQARYAEVRRTRFRRGVALSKELDADKVSAEFAHGQPRVRVPKAEHARPAQDHRAGGLSARDGSQAKESRQ